MSRQSRRLLAILSVALIVVVTWALVQHRRHVLKITFLDVGQGDACVVESPGGKVLLIDTGGIHENGGPDEGENTVVPFLTREGIRKVDIIVLTHPHADHIGGAGSLMERCPVDTLIDNGQQTESHIEARVLEEASRHHVKHVIAQRGQWLDFGDGVTAEELAPTDTERQGSPNNASVVIRLRYGRTSFLFMGDAEAPEEQDLLNDHDALACDVLKVGHHGSHTSTTPEMLAAAHPHIAIVSVGRHNMYGHPAREVISRLQQAGAKVYRTDETGAVTCISDGDTVTATAMQP